MTEDIVNKIERGSTLSDKELTTALGFYEGLSDKLELLGPAFLFAHSDIYHVLEQLEGFERSRMRQLLGFDPPEDSRIKVVEPGGLIRDLHVINKIEQGDALSDEELVTALTLYGSLVDELSLLGPTFHLVLCEIRRIQVRLKGFASSRVGFALGESSSPR